MGCAKGSNPCLTHGVCRLQAKLGTLDAVLRLCLLVCQGSLHCLLCIQALRLQRRSLVLHVGLLLVAEVGKRHLHAGLCAQLLRPQ